MPRSFRSLAERIAHSSEHDGPRRSEDGDTLIEVLLAIVILGLASVAIITAFATSISSSAEHRSLATFDTVLRSASQEAIAQLQEQTKSEFETCPGTYSVNFSLPTGYSAVISSVQYWNGTHVRFDVQGRCTPAGHHHRHLSHWCQLQHQRGCQWSR